MKFIKNLSLSAMAGLMLLLASCDKTKPYEIVTPSSEAHFIGKDVQVYAVETDPVPAYNVVIGTTDVSDKDRVVKFKITSPSGAVAGTQYTISGVGADGIGSVTIKAKEALASVTVQAIYSAYTTGRKDSLIFNIIESDVKPAGFLNPMILVLRGPCFEGSVNLNELLGDYLNTNEDFGGTLYGPYATAISAVSSSSATSGTITVDNIYDFGWAPITFKLDWSDPANRTVTLDQQEGLAGGSTLGLDDTYQVMVRAFEGEVGTFSGCTQKLTLKMQVGAKDATGAELWAPSLYIVELAR
jgi:hypothetical protein